MLDGCLTIAGQQRNETLFRRDLPFDKCVGEYPVRVFRKFSRIRDEHLLEGGQLNISHIGSLRRGNEIPATVGACTKPTATGHQQLRSIGRQQHARGSPAGGDKSQRLVCARIDHGHGVETQQRNIQPLSFSIDRDAEGQISAILIQPGIGTDRDMPQELAAGIIDHGDIIIGGVRHIRIWRMDGDAVGTRAPDHFCVFDHVAYRQTRPNDRLH